MRHPKAHDILESSPHRANLPELLELAIQEHLAEKERHGDRDVDAIQTDQRLVQARRQRVTHPVIYVGAGTCGLGAGAAATLKAIHSYLDRHEIRADVVVSAGSGSVLTFVYIFYSDGEG